MAKRDKLYTVNKWNKPFFEDDRRKRLYALGDRIIYGLKEGLGAERNSYGDVGGVDANVKMPSYLQKAFTSFNDYANPSHYQNLAKVNFAEGDDKPLYGSNITNDTSSTGTKSASLWSTAASGVANAAPDLVKAGILYFNHPETGELMAYTPPDLSKGILKSSMVSIPNPDLKPFAAGVASKLPTAPSLAPTLSEHLGIDTAALTSEATKKAVGEASQKLVKQFPSHAAAKGKNFFSTNLGLGLALTAADLGGDYLRSLARKPELNDTTAARVGDVLSKAGTLVGTGLMATGYGLPVGLLALGVGKALGAIADQFGSKFIDRGARNRATQLRGINTNGSDEYLGNLWAMVSPGEEDSYVRGIFAGSRDKNRAQANNEDMYDAVEDAQRNIRDAWRNNQFMRYQHALSDYGVTAMGGKLNRCKCNKKATGGILNNSYIDTSSPSGYDIMMTALGNQEQKNQMQQDTNNSLGNSFISTPNMSTIYAKGGPMIKPENRGKLTELKKRTGKTEAELYNDGNPEHKKMVVFARNARKWKKAYGGFLDAANSLAEAQGALYGAGGKLNYDENKNIRNNSFLNDPTLFALGGIYQAAGSNWGKATEINAGGTHEESPYDGVQVGVDPEGTPNLVEEGEVIWNDYVFSNRIECPKEVCKALRVGVKKNGFTFAEVAKKLLNESKERPNDPISKRGLEANMQKLEDAQEEVKKKMEADEAVEQFNNLPPEQLVAIMQQEGEKAQNAVALEQMAQELLNMPPEQQQAIAQQMTMGQALAQGIPQGPSPEELAMMQQLMAQLQMPQGINPQEALAQAAAMLQAGLNGAALGGKLCFGGRRFAEGGELTEQPLAEPETAGQPIDSEMAKYSDEELQDMIEDYQEAESGEVKVTKGKLARLRKKAEKAQSELERRHADENEEQPQEARQEPSQEELQAAALAQAMQAQQPIEGQPQGGIPQEGMSPEQAMMMLQQMGAQPQMSPEEMAMLLQQGGQLYAYGGRLYLEGGPLGDYSKLFPDVTDENVRNFWEMVWKSSDVARKNYKQELFVERGLKDPHFAHYILGSVYAAMHPETKYMLSWGDKWDDPESPVGPNAETWKPISDKRLAQYRKYVEDSWDTEDAQRYAKAMGIKTKEEYVQNHIKNLEKWNKYLSDIDADVPDVSPAAEELKNTSTEKPVITTPTSTTTPTASATTTVPDVPATPTYRPIVPRSSTLTGEGLLSLLGFDNYYDAAAAGFKDPSVFGLSDWGDYLDPNTFKWDNKWLNYKGVSPDVKYAIENGLYDPGQMFLNEDNAPWFEPTRGTGEYNWVDFKGSGKNSRKYDGNDIVGEEEFKALKSAFPNTLKGLDYHEGLTLGDVHKVMRNSDDWIATQSYLRDPKKGAERRAAYMAEIVKNNLDPKTGKPSKDFRPTQIYEFIPTGGGNFKAFRKKDVSEADELKFWDQVQDDQKYGDMYNTYHVPKTKVRYFVKDNKGGYKEYFKEPNGLKQIGSDLSSYIRGENEPADKIEGLGTNQIIKFYEGKDDSSDNSKKPEDSNLMSTTLHRKSDPTGLLFSLAPGALGLAATLIHGKPDTSGLKNAIDAYANNVNTSVRPHLTHGYMRPDIKDPYYGYITLNQLNNAINRMLQNTGPAPSLAANIIANDMKYQTLEGERELSDRKYNTEQRQLALLHNTNNVNTVNANILNETEYRYAQLRNNAAENYARLNYNAEKEKLDQDNAWWAGVMGNTNSLLLGTYNWWREDQNRWERNMLAASLAPQNDWFAQYYGISNYNPNTGLITSGADKGKYLDPNNPNNGKRYKNSVVPSLATQPIVATTSAAKGGKLKRKTKKRKGFTF